MQKFLCLLCQKIIPHRNVVNSAIFEIKKIIIINNLSCCCKSIVLNTLCLFVVTYRQWLVLWFMQIRYAEHLPSVLKNINCTFPGRKKVGVVGRTGSGKSTLIQAIFRIVEPREGRIIIDDVDITKIGLHELRSRLSIIPQDPTMFEGTVRGNLDPLGQYSDCEVWEVYNLC